MTFEELFGLFYTKYRGEETPPATTDPEWAIAVRNYNDALQRMANYDDTKWNFLQTTLQTTLATGGVKILATGTTSYAAPSNMAEPGGILTYIDTNNYRRNYQIVQPWQVQALSQNTPYGYFTGDQHSGYILHVNPAPVSTQNGYGIDYNYYRKPTRLNATTETGSSIIEGGDPSFYYMHMVAQRFLDSRNFPAYQVALRDSEEALKNMKLKNYSGSHYNAWTMQDTGPGFGY